LKKNAGIADRLESHFYKKKSKRIPDLQLSIKIILSFEKPASNQEEKDATLMDVFNQQSN
jgi:hypothetical protein